MDATRWPFSFVVDERGRATGWVALHAPIQSPSRRTLFAEHRRTARGFVGFTSFLTWPDLEEVATGSLDYAGVCEAWCHCFRHPDAHLPPTGPRAELAWSDFVDGAQLDPASLRAGDLPAFDVVYVAASQDWKWVAKGWDLARRCIARLCRAGLRVLVVDPPPRTVAWTTGVTLWPRMPWATFLGVLASARVLFVPSESDPSPRVLAEALCLDVPIVVNRSILGGWSYVAPDTGAFFDGEDDVVDVVRAVVDRPCAPRAWWLENRGPERAGATLRSLLERVDPDLAPGGSLGLAASVRATVERG